jgi:hypothetical protein
MEGQIRANYMQMGKTCVVYMWQSWEFFSGLLWLLNLQRLVAGKEQKEVLVF